MVPMDGAPGLKIIKKCLRQETPDLSSIKAKTLILSSTKDEIFPIKHAQELNKGIKNSQLKTFDGNHSWMLFKTNEFKKAIKNFMSI